MTELNLGIRTAVGSIRIAKPVECLIVPGTSAEFVQGNDLLTMLGIDVEKQLDVFVATLCKVNKMTNEPEIGSSVELNGEVRAAIEKIIDKASEKGFPMELVPGLWRIATRFDIWRLKLGDAPPARISPMKIGLKAGARTYRCKARRYPPEFRDDFNDELFSQYAKKQMSFARQRTTNLLPHVEAIVGIMPDLYVDLEDVMDAAFLGGYWQIELAEECQGMLTYMTHRKGYTPRRVIQGSTDATLLFQSTIQKRLEELMHMHWLVGIDNLLRFAKDASTYLVNLEILFELPDFLATRSAPKKSNYAHVIRPLQNALDSAPLTASRHTKCASDTAVDLSVTEGSAYDEGKQLISTNVALAFPKQRTTTCLRADANDSVWSVIVPQVPDWLPRKEVYKQQHGLFICLSGSFTGSQNLIYVFAPGKEVKKHLRGKLLRWSTKLMEYRNISTESSTHDDSAFERDAVKERRATFWLSRKRQRIRNCKPPDVVSGEAQTPAPEVSELRPLDDPNFEWPTLSAIVYIHTKHAEERPRSVIVDDENGWFIKDRVWIPKGAPWVGRTIECVGRHVDINHLPTRVDNFLRACIMCKYVNGSKIVQRPWGDTYRANERNGAVQFDYLSTGDSIGGDRYCLVLKDEATQYTELTPCTNPTSVVVMRCWRSTADWGLLSKLIITLVVISGQGSHFRNEVMTELGSRSKARHEFTVPYSPWINGSVERANRDIAQVLRVLYPEYKVDIHDWTYFVLIIQSSLNHTPVPTLGKRAPVELFYGLPLPSPLTVQQLASTWLGNLQKRIRDLHKLMIRVRADRTVRNKRTQKYARVPNFDVGYYVLRSRVDQNHYDKLLVGPYEAERADKHSFAVRYLLTGEETDVHPSRLKFYVGCSLQVTEELRNHVAALGLVLSVQYIKEARSSVVKAWDDNVTRCF
ncbi:LOW QUALITY PROTEIN: hypothetical protein PHMEG_00011171 [Phytophthora megakarya]|uniref:Integrase catalytic domain-containing protein n=1 Tax=Phytophthora megakarya TaxID=4795 RepID=A0A225WCT8_9STRA|nr:LOW QUALITY PROTEIN: hypothetical protein PHMEG_00011171 [Phytophthora megakarya]